ncbi:MAG: GerAB/ArcD/ProY family transporter, partial [Christensenellales bacterium]
EIVMILGIADLINVRDKPHVIFMKSALTSTGILMMITLRNILVLGPVVMSSSYFPSYMAVRVMSLGDFLSRLEGSISINFMLAGITKLTLCLIVASRGIAHLFGLKTWRNLVYPTGLLMVALSEILYQNTMEMYQFIIYYPYYAALFQVVLPAATWIVSEVRAKRNSAKAQLAGQSAQ